jgi:hypothetical protein
MTPQYDCCNIQGGASSHFDIVGKTYSLWHSRELYCARDFSVWDGGYQRYRVSVHQSDQKYCASQEAGKRYGTAHELIGPF